ncbi:MAG TPA: hypothetical protein VFN22_02025 [Gemmatimonadales bacterium]|nr:hypothetical protein [Gemmatimonadales bacterium]
MRLRTLSLPALLMALPLLPITGQRSNDESRLVVGITGGYIGGTDLWAVEQPITTNTTESDRFALARRLRGNITVGGHLTYFPRPSWGVTGEVVYLGLGTRDQCALVTPSNDGFNRLACASLENKERAASAVAVMGGGVWRPVPRGDIQLYLKVQGGLALVPRSTTTMTAFFGIDDDFALPIYAEDGSKDVAPIGAAAIGFATAPNRGYQFSLEFRATAARIQLVDGPAPVGVLTPPIRGQWKLLPTITAGFEIVLERHRGRRY